MKKNVFGWSLAALFAFALVPAFGQDIKVRAPGADVKVQAPGIKVDAPGVKVEAPGVRVDAQANTAIRAWHASKLIGANVQNSENKSLGTVNDLIVDDRGRTHYVILAHGGVLGVGQKLFAVPVGAISFHKTQDEGIYVLFNIKPEILEKGTGFTSDTWPDFTNAKIRETNDKFFTDAGVKVIVDTDRTPIRDR